MCTDPEPKSYFDHLSKYNPVYEFQPFAPKRERCKVTVTVNGIKIVGRANNKERAAKDALSKIK